MESFTQEIDKDLEIDNLPNRLTIFRVLLVPVVIGLLSFIPLDWVLPDIKLILGQLACFFFVIASITDFFDGMIARKRNIVTIFGSFLDPIADKFLTVSSLIMLQGLGRVHPLIVIILVLREMYMTSLRLLAMHEGISVPVIPLGKWKTTAMMVGIPMLMINEVWYDIPFSLIGTALLLLACFLSIWSATSYSLETIKKLKHARLLKKQKRREMRQLKRQQKQQIIVKTEGTDE